MRLTNNFTLEELIASTTASEHGIAEQFCPSQEVKDRLKLLCEKILQPVREELGFPLTITSGYRCKRVNDITKGAKNSDHLYGMAADIICMDNAKLFEALKKYPFKQLIWEYDGQWVHVSYDKSNLKKEILYIK